jgi:hypothetical protein
MNEDLRKWFGTGGEGGVGGGGWDEYNTKGERTGKCARGKDDDGEGPKPKCLSKEKAAKMTKKEIAAAVRRKREKDPVADRPGKGGKPKMVSNNIGEEKNQKDHEYSMARSELATIENAVKRLKAKMKGEGNIEAWVQSKITKAADYIDTAADYVDSGEHDSQESMDEAKKGPCWKGYRKKSGTADYEKGSCVKVSEASFEITHTSSDARRAKRAKKIDTLTQRGTGGEQKTAARMAGVSLPPVRKEEISLVDKILLEMEAEVLTEKNKPTNPKLWAKWKSKAKAKFDVYPSAYANGWAAKGYKSEGGGWKSVSEDVKIEDADGNTFAEVIDIIKPEPLVSEKKECPKCNGKGCKHCNQTGYHSEESEESEEIEESVRMPAKNGNIIFAMVSWRGKVYSLQMFFPSGKRPTRTEVQDQVRKVYPDSRLTYFNIRDYEPGQPLLQVEDWQKANRQDNTDGMSQGAVDKYKKENPGSKLKTAVTEKNPTGKRAERQNSFCRRSKGQKDMHNIDCTKTPDKPICKARRRWNCKGDS